MGYKSFVLTQENYIYLQYIMQRQQTHNTQLIYYVLPNQKVNMAQVSSPFQIYQDQVEHDLTSQGTINALKYRHGLNYLGKSYSQVKVPCTPARQPRFIGMAQKNQKRGQQLPYLVKVPNQSGIEGYASGKRSAIVQHQNTFLRYKGCGYFSAGFTLQNNQPRGCHYFHTLKRELLMTNKVNQILKRQIGVTSANIPKLGFQYSHEDMQKLNISCEAQMIGKYCCIFETLGDRRVGTHIISPLQVVFLNMSQFSQVKWFEVFEKNGRIENGEPVEFLANWLFLQPGQQFLTKLQQIDPKQNYITLDQISLQNISTQKKNLFVQKALYKLVKNQEQKQYVRNYLNSLKQNIKDVVSVIVQKVGYQMGQIKRIFCEYGMNWGYFNDHGALWHCNAHLNNFVSTVPKAGSQFLLALDFDLSFFRQQFIRIDLDQQGEASYGKYDKDQFQNFLCSQYQAMELSVSGLEFMSNFQYSIYQDSNTQSSPLSPMKMAKIAFRDTLLKSFRSGMRRDKSQKQKINKKWDQNIQTIHQVTQLCLTISQDFQT